MSVFGEDKIFRFCFILAFFQETFIEWRDWCWQFSSFADLYVIRFTCVNMTRCFMASAHVMDVVAAVTRVKITTILNRSARIKSIQSFCVAWSIALCVSVFYFLYIYTKYIFWVESYLPIQFKVCIVLVICLANYIWYGYV